MATSKEPEVEDDKYGMFVPYMRKFFFEERDYAVDESIFYEPDEEILPNTIELVKKFLKQVRETRGYDVDCCPPSKLNSPFIPIPLDEARSHRDETSQRYYARMVRAAEFAIQKINADTGQSYKLVEIEKAVHSRCLVMFLTLSAKEDEADAPMKTFQATVYVPAGKDPRVDEWRVKPFPATSTSGGA